ncbi:DEAD/DEAH box helicase [Desulfurivibrio alkaliphilus]|uniref:DEAD-box ATP-dependent RNA helicase RhpA n=1 Tax=Desulfurivibrio alkaliphilus (strain DSM 19089 / UNIQEM U267 / AHT2) TaxID=589865 RepID=D6Z2B7_DESAT|nr:DEAD/DEAH box helicase [Desulfurivibrio alkaliphilus]ADH85692.1 DEAD/DEAH box helicase domain protein [Desulfurivibrio alkaliphilus AHT 2]
MTFNELGLRAELLRAVSESGYSQPSPIQSKAIPVVLQGGDLLAGAQTGTGKTAGFALPLLQRLSEKPAQKSRPIRALVLTPTRELAAQVEASFRLYGKHLPLRTTVVFGGVSIRPQITTLRQGVDILVATPGRLLDHVSQKTIDLSKVEMLVLDEADRMLDMGFLRDIRKILALLPIQRQNLLFSATFSDEIKRLADGLLKSPTLIEVARRNTAAEQVDQAIYRIDKGLKRALLSHLISGQNWQQVLVFTRTKHGANRLAGQLAKDGISSTAIHGNKSQGARTRALADFKQGKVRVLVATDIAARGLDIEQLPHVVNYELPNVPEDYVHRIGRTGRAGCSGNAISFVCAEEHKQLHDIESLLKRRIPLQEQEPGLTLTRSEVDTVRHRTPRRPATPAASRRQRTGGNRSTAARPDAGKAKKPQPGANARSARPKAHYGSSPR